MTIKIFGKEAEQIKQGQQYIAVKLEGVEGRTVVELLPINS